MKEPIFFEDLPYTLVVDFTGLPPLPYRHAGAADEEEHSHAKVVRRVLGRVRVTEDLTFSVKRKWVTLAQGTVVELIEPNGRDRKDLEYQKSRFGKQFTTIRWGEAYISIVPSVSVERV